VAAQEVHELCPAVEAVPAAQVAHTLLEAVVVGEYKPPMHAVQKLWPTKTWYMPAAQFVHAAAPADEYFPTAQSKAPQAARPVEGLYRPAVHVTHEPNPVVEAKYPAEHGVQVAADPWEYWPAGHAIVVIWPAVSWYCPAGHGSMA
jgi:hypothetical protein